MTILVTGGAGYIGSHACVELLDAGYRVVVVVNLMNSSAESLKRVVQLTGKELSFHQIDLLDRAALRQIFLDEKPEAVIHFAGLKAVGESVREPLQYFENNLIGTLNLLMVMQELSVKQLIFRSSATVYGEPEHVPVSESAPLCATNPYGRTKLMIEEMLQDLFASDPSWKITILRYFNPVGAHESGRIGEDPTGTPNNLFPFVTQVAVGKRDILSIFGDDYSTPDGTCVRDYLHVVDLAQGHVAALRHLAVSSGIQIYNLGTGRGSSVLEVLAAFERATGVNIAREIAPRRAGDSAATFADATLAKKNLGWVATRTLDQMCVDAWRWQSENPSGYLKAVEHGPSNEA
jgi:UDP-glucose 4-epimerase